MDGATIISGEPQQTGVTTFANEACEKVDALSPYVLGSYLEPSETQQDLRKYFERPRCIAIGTIPVGSFQAPFFNLTMNQLALTNAFPQWSQRLAGAYGITFDMRFKVVVAASPFHQGVLALGFQYGVPASSLSTRFLRSTRPFAVTNLPHVRLDLSEQTSVELVVPFLFTAAFMPVSVSDTNGLDIGSVGLNSIIPVETVTALAAPTYKVYITLENVQLYGADQAGVTTVTLQSGTMLEELKSSKLISTSLNQVAKVSSFIDKHIPVLSAIAGPTAWAAGIAAGAAKYFGFSQPVSNKPIRRICNHDHVDEHHVDKPYEGSVVSMFGSNTLAFSRDFASSDIDEMSLKFVLSQYSQICLARVSTGDTHGLAIYASPVSIPAFWFRSNIFAPYCNIIMPFNSSSTSTNSIFPSTLLAVASMFRSWRGTIKFRFTFGKSKYHAGRYLITFNPSVRYGNELSNLASRYTNVEGPEITGGAVQPYGMSLMCDLRDGNVFEFDVPYMTENPYLPVMASGSGSIVVTCIDPLQAPSTVASSIGVLVEVAGGDDFEVADYAGNHLVSHPLGSINTQSGKLVPASAFYDYGVVQSGAMIGSSTVAPCEDTMGEHITSLKQVIMHPVSYALSAVVGTNWMVVPPWWVHGLINALGGLTAPMSATANYQGASYTPSYVASMYAYARGSTDVSLYIPTGTGSGVAYIEQRPSDLFNAWYTAAGYLGRWNAAAAPKVVTTFGNRPGVLHARLPTFANNVRVPTWVGNSISTFTRSFRTANLVFFGSPGDWISHFYRIVVPNNGGAALNTVVKFSAGEDAMLAQFIGPEPILLPNSAGTSTFSPEWLNTFG